MHSNIVNYPLFVCIRVYAILTINCAQTYSHYVQIVAPLNYTPVIGRLLKSQHRAIIEALYGPTVAIYMY